jgi:XRE family transcriptional regulator, regulator of sulfur utilization
MGISFRDWSREVDARAQQAAADGDDTQQRLSDAFARHFQEEANRLTLMQQLAWRRQQQNITQCQLSELSGVDQGQISRIERGQVNPGIDLLNRLSGPLGVRVALVDAQGRLVEPPSPTGVDEAPSAPAPDEAEAQRSPRPITGAAG